MIKPRLRWKKEKKETGLRRIGAGPVGHYYHDGDKIYARVSPQGGGWRGPLLGWYWVAGGDSGIPYKNTCDSPCRTIGEAKELAANYVNKNLPNK